MNRQRVAELFEQAVELPPGERASWLAAACGDDTELQTEIERLLRADARAADFMERPPALVSAAIDASATGSESMPRFGPWQALQKIGVGGMGEVWLAERADGEFEQRVAVKQLAWPTPGLLQRFRQERQILARLQHPNIARLIDGGVDAQGAPYLVMEYIQGVPITDYVRVHVPELRARLELFLRVCDAVQYAHQNLVVHRDLKPSNIFVAVDGTPKLLDFGIAKVLATTDASEQTQTAARLLTPDYAAPEQFSGGAITTATDVYALGVVLYELLADTRPERPMPALASAAMQALDPLPPSAAIERTTSVASALRRALRGDLDRIALSALAAEPQRRYPSVEAFAADIRRYLDGRPIAAQRDRAGYRLRKFIQRNRYALAAAAFVFAVCIAATAISLRQASIAQEQAARAEQQAQRALAVRKFLIGVFEQAKPDENKGQPFTAEQLLGIGERQLAAGVDNHPAIRADLTGLIGSLYWDIGDYTRAEPLLKQAVEAGADSRVTNEIRARNLLGLATMEKEKRTLDAAYDHANQALALAQVEAGVELDEGRDARRSIADILFTRGDAKQAEPILRQLLVDDRSKLGDSDDVVAGDLNLLGGVLGELARYDEAEVAFRGAIKIYAGRHGDVYSELSSSYNELGQMLLHKGDLAGAESALRAALDGVRKLYGAQSNNAWTVESNLLRVLEMKGQFQTVLEQRLLMSEQEKKALTETRPDSLAFHANLIGVDYRELGQFDQAVAAFREALSIWAKVQGSNTESNSANPLFNLGVTLVLQGHYDEAETALRNALAIQQKHEQASSQWLNNTRSELGNLLQKQHRNALALRELREAIVALTTTSKDSANQSNATLSTLQSRLAEAELDADNGAEADTLASQALALARKALPEGNYRLGTALFASGHIKLTLGDATNAEALLREALAVRLPLHAPSDPRVLEVKVALINALTAQRKTDEAHTLTAEVAPLLAASTSAYAAELRERLGKN